MTGFDDDLGMTRRDLDDRAADRLLSGRPVEGADDLAGFVAALAATVPAQAPAPSAALAAMIEAGIPLLPVAPVVPAARRRAVSWRYALAGLAAAVTAVVGAGAANALPAPAQRAVADVVGWISPLHLPRPHEHGVVPVPTSSPSPEPTAEQTGAPAPTPAVTRAPEHHAGRTGTEVRPDRSGSAGDGSSSGDSPAPRTTASTSSDGGGGSSDGGGSSPTPEPSSTDSPSSDGGSPLNVQTTDTTPSSDG